jgi:CheY-like chemotaxis protein
MPKILIAEDEPDIRELVTFMLRFAGYEVVAASNGEDAVRTAAREIPDLVIMDVRMPRMTGYDACRLMKANPDLRHVPVVSCLAKGQESEINPALTQALKNIFSNPFHLLS